MDIPAVDALTGYLAWPLDASVSSVPQFPTVSLHPVAHYDKEAKLLISYMYSLLL